MFCFLLRARANGLLDDCRNTYHRRLSKAIIIYLKVFSLPDSSLFFSLVDPSTYDHIPFERFDESAHKSALRRDYVGE